jgi:hypothetical protein
MKVKELITQLEHCNPEAIVFAWSDQTGQHEINLVDDTASVDWYVDLNFDLEGANEQANLRTEIDSLKYQMEQILDAYTKNVKGA